MSNVSNIQDSHNPIQKAIKPVFYYFQNQDHRVELENLIKSDKVHVYDHIYGQLKELMKIKHPKIRIKADDYEPLINTHLNGCNLVEYGVWVYYPWSRNLIHILDREEFIDLRTAANRQKITYEERDLLAGKKVGVIGLSVGQSVAITLALERGCGELRIADFDTIELNNLNRLRTGLQNLGVLKAHCVAREIAEIDPFFKVVCYTDGITAENIDDFFTKDGKLDLVIDECDGVDVKIRCRLKARELNVPVLMEASDRGTVDVERFDLHPGMPIMHGWLEHLSLDLDFLGTLKTSEEKLPYILPIAGTATLSSRMKASMMEIEQTITTWPQLASAVALGGGVTADTCRRIFLNQFTQSGRYFIDMEKIMPEPNHEKNEHIVNIYPGVSATEIKAAVAATSGKLPTGTIDPGKAVIDTVVAAAITAPTGGNAQPWKWHFSGSHLYLFIDATYGPKMIDYANTATYLGFGAAADNLIIKAQSLGLDVNCTKFPLGHDSKLIAVFSFYNKNTSSIADPLIPFDLAGAIEKRVVNRNVVPRVPIADARLQALREVARSVPGADMNIITDPDQLEVIADIMAKADKIRVMNKAGHIEFLAETNWTEEEGLRTRRGISLDMLDLTPSEVTGFKIIRDWNVVQHLSDWKGGTGLEKLTRKTAAGASAVGLVTMPSYSMENIFDGGRALERVWLAANKDNIAFQPISISVFIFHRMRNEGLGIFSAHAAEEIMEMRKNFQKVFPDTLSRCEILMFRLFIADEPAKRSLRTSVDEILSYS